MRFHVVSVPYTHTTRDFTMCGFTEKVRKFCDMMTGLGHEVSLYAGERNEAAVAEHVVCISEMQRQSASPENLSSISWDVTLPEWKTFLSNVILEIGARKRKGDFLCMIGGLANKPIVDAHPDLVPVEFGIGYTGVFAPFRVWESYAWMHTVNAANCASANEIRPQFYDAVIPSYFEVDMFPRGPGGNGYLFMGRMVETKGYRIAELACEHLKADLTLVGHGDRPSYGEHLTQVTAAERARLMGSAVALFAPTLYVEPFGNVVVESLLCGTPAITTPWGAFTETVQHGVNGFHCHTLGEFVEAARECRLLDRERIAADARQRYSMIAIAPKYDTYFQRVETLWADGWYTIRTEGMV